MLQKRVGHTDKENGKPGDKLRDDSQDQHRAMSKRMKVICREDLFGPVLAVLLAKEADASNNALYILCCCCGVRTFII